MTAKVSLLYTRDGLWSARASSIAAGCSGIGNQAPGAPGKPRQLETSGKETSSRRGPIVVRRACLFLVSLPVLCLWFSAARGQEIGSGKKWDAPALQEQRKNPVPANESSIDAGRKIYLKRCAACHGKTGEGDGPDAVDLGIHPAKFSDSKLRTERDGALFWKITAGKKPMPDYGGRLSSTDRWNVINFLRTLAKE